MNLVEKFRESFKKKGEELSDEELETIVYEVKVHRKMVVGDTTLTPEKPAVKEEVSDLEKRIAKLEESERGRSTYGGVRNDPISSQATATPRQKSTGSYRC